MDYAVSVEKTLGGLRTISGGTKTRVTLSRPWQRDIDNDPSLCPFCNPENMKREPDVQELAGLHEMWLVLRNKFTRYSFHLLIIPKAHWPNEKLRTLGNENSLNDVLTIAGKQMAAAADHKDMLVGVHIGAYAGQNVPHLHFHLLSAPPQDAPAPESPADTIRGLWRTKPLCRIYERNGYRVFAHGIRSGQCYIIPDESSPAPPSPQRTAELALVLSSVVRLYKERFTSAERLPPDFMLSLTYKDGIFVYATYIPVLNHWGCTEYAGLAEQRPIGLPWPHEETVRHLRQE